MFICHTHTLVCCFLALFFLFFFNVNVSSSSPPHFNVRVYDFLNFLSLCYCFYFFVELLVFFIFFRGDGGYLSFFVVLFYLAFFFFCFVCRFKEFFSPAIRFDYKLKSFIYVWCRKSFFFSLHSRAHSHLSNWINKKKKNTNNCMHWILW